MATALGQTLVSMAGGALAGVVVASVWSGASGDAGPLAAPRVAEARGASDDESRPSTHVLSRLERRVAELEVSANTPGARAGEAHRTQATGAATDEEPPTRVEAPPYEEVIAGWEERLAAHAAEPVAGEVSARYGERLEAGVTALETKVPDDVHVGALDCRSSTCSLTVLWPSHRAAVDGYGVVVHHAFGANCWSQMVLPESEPGTAEQPYEGTLLLSNCIE